MRPQAKLSQLGHLRQLCDVFSDHAYLAMSAATGELARRKEAHQALHAAETEVIAGWTAAMNQAAPSPYMLLLWQQELTQCKAAIARSQTELTEAEEKLGQARKDWRIAHEKADIVTSRRAEAIKRYRASQDEQGLAQIEDIHHYRSIAA